MQWLKANIDSVNILLQQETQESLTYAALECRLALEMVCYERLRTSYDYISYKELRRWQPRYVIESLIAEANETAATDFTLSISTEPVDSDADPSAADFQRFDYVEVGRQVGFDPKYIGKLWNAISSFLHVRLPSLKSDTLDRYGNSGALKAKVEEGLKELRRLQKGTLISSGFGEEVSFNCRCGSKTRRRAALLKDKSVVTCINPECDETYRAHETSDGSFEFERLCVEVKCRGCGDIGYFPEKQLIQIGLNRAATYDCSACGERNALRWSLQQAELIPAPSTPS